VGKRALAGGPVGGELAIVHLDNVLGLAAAAVDVLVEMPRLCEPRGDDVAGIEAAGVGLQTGDDVALPSTDNKGLDISSAILDVASIHSDYMSLGKMRVYLSQTLPLMLPFAVACCTICPTRLRLSH
jgi:hypothetical protein